MSIWAKLLRQPVLVLLGAAALALFGLAALFTLPVRSSPIIPARYIDISTNFNGADAATIDHFVTLPLESSLASLSGVKYVTGTTVVDNSDINAFLADGASPDTVFAETLAGVNAERSNLPAGIQAPQLKLVGDDNANQEINVALLFPPSLTVAQVTELVNTSIIPRLETVPGIGPVYTYTGSPSLHVTMHPLQMQALGVTPDQLAQTLSDASTVSAAGTLRNAAVMMPVNDTGGLDTPAAFEQLPVATRNGVTIKLQSVASAAIGFGAGDDQQFWGNQQAVYIAMGIAPTGNIISVSRGVHEMVDQLRTMNPTVFRNPCGT